MAREILSDAPDILPLCYYGHPALIRKSIDVTEMNDDLRMLAQKMINTMRAENGIGLAAPQVGYNINLFVIEIPFDVDGPPRPTSPGEASLLPEMPLILINPRLSDYSNETTRYLEGCLSIPTVKAEVTRSEYVQIDAALLDGREISYRCGGLLARCLQHEYDHLNGVLFTDLLSDSIFKTLEPQLKKLAESTESKLDRRRRKKRLSRV